MKNHDQNLVEQVENNGELKPLIEKLKKEDIRYRGIYKRFLWIFYIMIILYAAFFILNPGKELTLTDRISVACFVLAFIVFAILFRGYYREFKQIDYSLPVSMMLRNAVKRYRLKLTRSFFLFIPILLIDAGVSITNFPRFTNLTPWERIGLVQLVYIPLMMAGALIGILIWYKRHKPIRDEANRLINELESQ
jgi:hypothetical protein